MDETIFRNQRGKPICHDNFVKRVFSRGLLESGVSSIPLHSMRHTGTTLMLAEGLDIKTVQEICGHQDIETTMGYVHLLAGSIERAARQFSVEPNHNEHSNLRLLKN